jgi:hypothetical protein
LIGWYGDGDPVGFRHGGHRLDHPAGRLSLDDGTDRERLRRLSQSSSR